MLDKFPLMAKRHPYCGDADDLSMLLRKLPFPLLVVGQRGLLRRGLPHPGKGGL